MLRTDLAERLKAAAHDVLRASKTGLDRADDSDILARAVADARTLVTLRRLGRAAAFPALWSNSYQSASSHFGKHRQSIAATAGESGTIRVPKPSRHRFGKACSLDLDLGGLS